MAKQSSKRKKGSQKKKQLTIKLSCKERRQSVIKDGVIVL